MRMTHITHIFECLAPVSRPVWEGSGGVVLLEEVCDVKAVRLQMTQCFSQLVLCLLLAVLDLCSQLLLPPRLSSTIMYHNALVL